jgi:hypothetical protein
LPRESTAKASSAPEINASAIPKRISATIKPAKLQKRKKQIPETEKRINPIVVDSFLPYLSAKTPVGISKINMVDSKVTARTATWKRLIWLCLKYKT